jgi:intracellular sulfur oxidation DsrE/DsrF family protein
MFLFALISFVVAQAASAQLDKFTKGPLIKNYGPVATIEGREIIPENTVFKVSFDLSKRAKPETINRNLEGAARFLNMHVAAGMKPKNLKLGLVVHGSAVFDFVNDEKYSAKEKGMANANKQLIKELIANGVEIHICGQSATYQGVSVKDLLPDVKMSLSAMTAHALFQQRGFTLNPF